MVIITRIIDKIKLINKLAEIRALLELDITKAKIQLSQLQTNLLENKGNYYEN